MSDSFKVNWRGDGRLGLIAVLWTAFGLLRNARSQCQVNAYALCSHLEGGGGAFYLDI
jgi:hypothetical protein